MGKLFNFNQAQSYKQDSDVCFLEGDVFANIKKIPDESVNLVISSPPYNLNKEYEEKKAFDIYLKDMQPLLHELKRVIKNDGAICWQLGNYLTKSTSKKPAEIFPLDIFFYNEFKSLGFKLRNRIIWHFRSGMHAKKRLSGRYETMMWFSKSDDFIFNLDQIRVKQKYQGKVFPKSHKKAGQLSGNPNGMNPSDFWIFDYMAGNRKEDHAAVFDMPAPLSNRFFHLEVMTGLKEFKDYAIKSEIDDRIISFLNFRPNLLHRIDKNSPAWPSPRQWVKSHNLLEAGLDIDPAVGTASAAEFRSFCKIYKTLPNIEAILNGDSAPNFPDDLSAKYALCVALALRSKTQKQIKHSLLYLAKKGTTEWLNQCTLDIYSILKEKRRAKELIEVLSSDSKLLKVSRDISKLLAA